MGLDSLESEERDYSLAGGAPAARDAFHSAASDSRLFFVRSSQNVGP
jgi:hypothetical protein